MAQNKYDMGNDPAVKNYQVQDDAAIRGAGFSNKTQEERKLIAEIEKYSEKSMVVCLILSIVHLHYFYLGRVGIGLLCLFTANFLYIGWIVDVIFMLSGRFKDKNGKIVNEGRRTAAQIRLNEYYRTHSNN